MATSADDTAVIKAQYDLDNGDTVVYYDDGDVTYTSWVAYYTCHYTSGNTHWRCYTEISTYTDVEDGEDLDCDRNGSELAFTNSYSD